LVCTDYETIHLTQAPCFPPARGFGRWNWVCIVVWQRKEKARIHAFSFMLGAFAFFGLFFFDFLRSFKKKARAFTSDDHCCQIAENSAKSSSVATLENDLRKEILAFRGNSGNIAGEGLPAKANIAAESHFLELLFSAYLSLKKKIITKVINNTYVELWKA
jgi:hypothetical protein